MPTIQATPRAKTEVHRGPLGDSDEMNRMFHSRQQHNPGYGARRRPTRTHPESRILYVRMRVHTQLWLKLFATQCDSVVRGFTVMLLSETLNDDGASVVVPTTKMLVTLDGRITWPVKWEDGFPTLTTQQVFHITEWNNSNETLNSVLHKFMMLTDNIPNEVILDVHIWYDDGAELIPTTLGHRLEECTWVDEYTVLLWIHNDWGEIADPCIQSTTVYDQRAGLWRRLVAHEFLPVNEAEQEEVNA